MTPKWTSAQLAAINIRGCDILVSAAAGSGKTAALTERIIRSLTREDCPTDITRILAVTFTRASAADLRRKLREAISRRLVEEPGNKRLIRQMMLLGSAKICTIDAFYNDIVRSNFQRLSLPAGFRIADEDELKMLSISIMEALINRSYSTNPAFPALADLFADHKSDAALATQLIDIYETIRKYPEGIVYLKNGAELLMQEAEIDFFESRAGSLLADALKDRLRCYLRILKSAADMFESDENIKKSFMPPVSNNIKHINTLLSAVASGNYELSKSVAQGYSPVSFGKLNSKFKTEESEDYRAQISEITGFLKGIPSAYFSHEQNNIRTAFEKTAGVCLELYKFLSQFEKELQDEKLSRGICDFEDIRHYTLRLLVDEDGNPTDAAREYALRFDEIYIDEYQDVDAVQDIIFRALSQTAKRFMVGDIKQSIYGFRGAEPELFASYRTKFKTWRESDGYNPNTDGGVTVFMSNNFRCDKNVIDFVNLVCSKLFSACGESIGYVPDDDLIFSKATSEDYTPPKVSVTLISAPPKDKKSNSSDTFAKELQEGFSDADAAQDDAAPEIDKSEARFICSEISRLLKSGRLADGSAIRPRDIAVLCRTQKNCTKISEALTSLGIPTVSDSRKKFYEDPAVSLMISLLTIIDNPQKDIPLAAALRSPIFGFSMGDLTEIKKSSLSSSSLFDAVMSYAQSGENMRLKDMCLAFSEKFTAYRTLSRSLPADRLMRHIMNDTNILAIASAESGESGRSRVLLLYEYARQYEAGSFRGLYNFIKYIKSSIEADSSPSGEGATAGLDAVAVMTIHHSKGLEFPVCFVEGCAKRFTDGTQDRQTKKKKAFIPDRKVGPASFLRDSTGLALINNVLVRAAALNIEQSEIMEEMRLLYVAMTRARERLYITARYPYSTDKLLSKTEFLSRFAAEEPQILFSAKSYLEWLLLTLPHNPSQNAPYTFNVIYDSEIATPEPYLMTANEGKPENNVAAAVCPSDIAKTLRERFSFEYPYSHLTRIPAKISISRLYPGVLDDSAEDALENENSAEQIGIGGPVKALSIKPPSETNPPGADFKHENNSAAQHTTGSTEIHKTKIPLPSTPSFLEGGVQPKDGRDKGTATHVFLQFCDFDRCEKHGIENEIAYLCEKRFMSRDMANLVDRGQLEMFFASEFYRSVKSARWMRREQRFNILLPASSFTNDPAFSAELQGEELLIQGVIDLFFEDADGRLILCDYKTDRLTPAEIADKSLAAEILSVRHKLQLSYYAAAIERICGRAADRVLIYSLPLGDAIEIKTEKV